MKSDIPSAWNALMKRLQPNVRRNHVLDNKTFFNFNWLMIYSSLTERFLGKDILSIASCSWTDLANDSISDHVAFFRVISRNRDKLKVTWKVLGFLHKMGQFQLVDSTNEEKKNRILALPLIIFIIIKVKAWNGLWPQDDRRSFLLWLGKAWSCEKSRLCFFICKYWFFFF